MARIYYLPIAETATATAAKDLLEIIPAANHIVELIGLHLYQTADATENEKVPVVIHRGGATSGSGGASVTPVAANPGDAAASFTAEVHNGTQATSGTVLKRESIGFAFPINRYYPDEMKIECSATENRLVVELESGPTAAITIGGWAVVKEYG